MIIILVVLQEHHKHAITPLRFSSTPIQNSTLDENPCRSPDHQFAPGSPDYQFAPGSPDHQFVQGSPDHQFAPGYPDHQITSLSKDHQIECSDPRKSRDLVTRPKPVTQEHLVVK